MGKVDQGHISPDAGILKRDDILGGAVFGIAGHLMRPDLPSEADAPQPIPHRLALHDVGRSHEGSEDDPRFAAIHHVVVVIAEADRTPVPYRCGVRIRRADSKVAGAAVAAVRGALRIEPPFLQQPPGRFIGWGHPLGVDRQRHNAKRQVGIDQRCSVVSLVPEQVGHVPRGFVVEAGDERRDAGIDFDLGAVEVQLSTPHETSFIAQIDDLLEEALEDPDPEPLPDAGQAGMIRERLVERVAEVPAVRQVEAGRLDELALRAEPLEEHDQMQLEEDHRVDAGTASLGIVLPDPLTDEAEIEFRLEVAVEVALRNECFQRDGDRLVEAAALGRTEHARLRGEGRRGNDARFPRSPRSANGSSLLVKTAAHGLY